MEQKSRVSFLIPVSPPISGVCCYKKLPRGNKQKSWLIVKRTEAWMSLHVTKKTALSTTETMGRDPPGVESTSKTEPEES